MKKKISVFLILILFLNSLFCFTRIDEALYIANYSTKKVIINYDFLEGESKESNNFMWEQTLDEFPVMIRDGLFGRKKSVILPNKTIRIISYYPNVSLLESKNNNKIMYSLPFLQKIKRIYKTLIISTEDGKKNINLDTIQYEIIKKIEYTGGVAYYIEIFDYDLVGKPASEW